MEMQSISELMGNTYKQKTCHCPIHGEYIGYAFESSVMQVDPECPKCREERLAKEKEEEKQAFINERPKRIVKEAKDRLVEAGADYDSVNVEFDNDTVTRTGALQKASKLLSGEITLLLIIGEPGRGKTVLASSITKRFAKQQEDSACFTYLKESQILRDIKSSYNARSSEAVVVDKLQNIPLLIIDEMTLDNKGIQAFEDIICYRFARKLPTILCGNIQFKDLPTKFTPRIMSRISGSGSVIELIGTDRRRREASTEKITLPAFRSLYHSIKGKEQNTNFVTDELLKADVELATKEAVFTLLKEVRDYFKSV